MKVKVYRIEDQKGNGCFRHMEWADPEFTAMPGPGKDWPGSEDNPYDNPEYPHHRWNENCLYAMPSLGVLWDFWSLKTLERLDKKGCHIVVYLVDKEDVTYGQSGLQCVFVPTFAEVVDTIGLLD